MKRLVLTIKYRFYMTVYGLYRKTKLDPLYNLCVFAFHSFVKSLSDSEQEKLLQNMVIAARANRRPYRMTKISEDGVVTIEESDGLHITVRDFPTTGQVDPSSFSFLFNKETGRNDVQS